MNAFVFLLLFTMPSFGGPVRATFEAPTLARCQELQPTITAKLNESGMRKYELVECHKPGPTPLHPGVSRFNFVVDDLKIEAEFQTLDGCKRIEKVILRELDKNNVTVVEHTPCR